MKKPYYIIIAAFLCILIIMAVRTFNNRAYKKPPSHGGRAPVSNLYPGEFEKQQAIWLQWPSEVYNAGSRPVYPVMINIIKSLDPYIRVNLLAE